MSKKASSLVLDLALLPQPTDTSCGPTCLHAIYHYYGDTVPVQDLIPQIPSLRHGGTLAVQLGLHALKRGYRARLYTYNLRIFDPTWFELPQMEFLEKLRTQMIVRKGKKLTDAAQAYTEFVERGGEIRLRDLDSKLIRKYLERGQPILTGLSATFLYRSMREMSKSGEDNDILGNPLGHFVVLAGYDSDHKSVTVADPYQHNPFSPERLYEVSIQRLINAILLGVLTYDANLLIIRPAK